MSEDWKPCFDFPVVGPVSLESGRAALLEVAAGGYRFRGTPAGFDEPGCRNPCRGLVSRARHRCLFPLTVSFRQISWASTYYTPHESDFTSTCQVTPISELPLGSVASILQYHRNDSDELRIRVRAWPPITPVRISCKMTEVYKSDAGIRTALAQAKSSSSRFPVMERKFSRPAGCILVRTKELRANCFQRGQHSELRLGLHHGT